MKRVILIALLLGLVCFDACQKKEIEVAEAKITSSHVAVGTTTATFSWEVDFPGRIASVIEVSENEDMSESKYYGSEEQTENKVFTVTVKNLETGKNYYYRILVWNVYYEDNKFVFEKKGFTTKEIPPIGAISGLFSISENTQVLFSQGNLQYQASTNTWRFAEHQWDYIGSMDDSEPCPGTVEGSSNHFVSPTYSGWIDLFGWGTSGWNCGNVYYHPYDAEDMYHDDLYGPKGCCDLTGSFANSDWGVYNRINNGGDMSGQWRTLSVKEWEYVFEKRNTVSGIRWVAACVKDVNGVLLLPDDWDGGYILTITNEGNAYGDINVIDDYVWSVYFESTGAVFLPAAGLRIGASVFDSGTGGTYWSSSNDGVYEANSLSWFCYPNFPYYIGGGSLRHFGMSVRLVRNVE